MFLRLSSRGLAGVLPPVGQILKKCTSLRILSILANFLCLPSRGLAGVLPPAGQSFEKLHFLENFVNLGEFFNDFQAGVQQGCCLRRVNFFEKLHFLETFVNFGEVVVPFKYGSSKGAASGGSEF